MCEQKTRTYQHFISILSSTRFHQDLLTQRISRFVMRMRFSGLGTTKNRRMKLSSYLVMWNLSWPMKNFTQARLPPLLLFGGRHFRLIEDQAGWCELKMCHLSNSGT